MTPENFCYWLSGALEFAHVGNSTTTAIHEKLKLHMKNEDYLNYCYWLQGGFEFGFLSEENYTEIKNHLDLVFTKVTPNNSEGVKDLLDKIREKESRQPDTIWPDIWRTNPGPYKRDDQWPWTRPNIVC